jgi:hypothetical protein
MDALIETVRGLAISQAFRDQVGWLWPVCESLHFLALCVLIGAAGLFDLRLLGLLRGVSLRAAHRFIPLAIGAFVVLAITGVIFLMSQPQQYFTNISMWFKALFLVVAGVNALVFEMAFSRRIMDLPADADMPTSARVIGAVSLVAWFAVLYFGRMLPYLDPNPRSGV